MAEAVGGARDAVLAAASYQDVTFARIVEHLSLGAEVAAHPVYQVTYGTTQTT